MKSEIFWIKMEVFSNKVFANKEQQQQQKQS